MKKVLAAVLLAASLACSQPSEQIAQVLDGDSIITSKGEEIRLSHIDAPEPQQDWGQAATDYVSAVCLGQRVVVQRLPKKDCYGRTLAEVVLPDGKILNQELVRNGLAWHYRRYSSDRYYQQLELEARAKKRGLWSGVNPTAPWDWRKQNR